MGKTLKRQRKRMAHAAARVDSAIHRVAFDPRDPLWATLEKELLDHVLVSIDEKLDAACPFEISFQLDLSSVRVACHDRIERAWRRVADAFAVLVAYAESLWQASYDERLQFWRWLDGNVPIINPHRAMLCASFIINFVWRSRPFDRRVVDVIYDAMVADRAVFEVKAQRAMNARPLRTSVSIMHCILTVEDVRYLRKLLTVPEVNDTESSLFEVDSLVKLSLSHTSIKTDALVALADVIDTSPRRIDSLDFESSIPTTDEPPEYLAAFRRLMMALFCPTQPSHRGHGIGLSLSHNQLQAVHIEALQIALSQATRPLCSLSLDGLDGANEATCRRVGELFFSTDARMANDECELHLSKVKGLGVIGEAIEASMHAAVNDAIPLVQQALADRVPVTCRPVNSREKVVVNVSSHLAREGTWFLVADKTSDDSVDSESLWVKSTTICCLKINGEVVVRSRFTALNAEGWDRAGLSIMHNIGPHLLVLSMHDYSNESTLLEMLKPCTKLKSLSLRNLYKTFRNNILYQHQLYLESGETPAPELRQRDYSYLNSDHIESLQVLLLEDCQLRPTELVSLRDQLARAPSTALRILGLQDNDINHEGLSVVHEILRQQQQIEYLELDAQDWSSHMYSDEVLTPCPEYASVRAQFDRDLQLEYVSKGVKTAFLSVLAAFQPLEPYTIEEIFSFAGRQAPHVAWVPGSRPTARRGRWSRTHVQSLVRNLHYY